MRSIVRAFMSFRRKLGWRKLIIGVVVLSALLLVTTLNPPPRKKAVDLHDLDPTTKRVLVWNDFFGAKHYGEPLGRSVFSGCRVTDCELWDRQHSDLDLPHDAFDAVIFHGVDTGWSTKRDLPLVRRPHQRYIFLNRESPATRPDYYRFNNFFNWTATYRRDSDFYIPYMNIREADTIGEPRRYFPVAWRDEPVFGNTSETFANKTRLVAWRDEPVFGNTSETFANKTRLVAWREPVFGNTSETFVNKTRLVAWREPVFGNTSETFANKTRLVAWFVSHSNTQSGRDYYVTELSKYIQVDVYGRGRRLSCTLDCDHLLDTTYKFYLSFENSLCVDYVTEKFLRALNHYVVPVVYGGADYRLYAPPLSYINVRDFASPRALARYLHYLDRHPEQYRKYFWWKEFYKQIGGFMWCDICEKLHDPEEPTQVYPDMESWWDNPGICSSPKDFFSRGAPTATWRTVSS